MTGVGSRDRRAERAARREERWRRPRQRRDWRFWVGGLGRVLIVIGLLMFGFVAYQLWGTGVEYSQAQDRLSEQFDELVAPGPTVAATSTTRAVPATSDPTSPPSSPMTSTPVSATTVTTVTPTTPSSTVAPPVVAEGDALARIEIPSIGLDAIVVAGVLPGDLKQGPGHYPGTPMPGQLGNSAIAGHRTTYGQPFFRLDEVRPGEQIVLTTVQGRFTYLATSSEVVGPNRGDVVLTKDPARATLTLTTCDPKYTATNRLILYADLDPGAVPLPPDLSYGPGIEATVPATTPPGSTTPGDSTPVDTSGSAVTIADAPVTADPGQALIEDAFSHGWFSDRAAWPQVALWGLAVTAIAVAGYLIARWFRRYWVGILVAVVPFVVALYFFYQNVNRLLPAAL